MSNTPTIRFAGPDDAETLHQFITALAVYEKEPDAVEATPASLRAQLEQAQPPFECLILEANNQPRGIALFFQSYSTWKGVPGVYLEDLFVPEDYRGMGYGSQLLSKLAAIAVERNCARLDWQVLDWNEPSIRFYESIGAEIKRDWLPCRLTGAPLEAMAAKSLGNEAAQNQAGA